MRNPTVHARVVRKFEYLLTDASIHDLQLLADVDMLRHGVVGLLVSLAIL